MRKTILIPTDFTVQSLNVVKSALNKSNPEYRLDIVFVHGIYLSSSITDLLFFSKKEVLAELSNPDFEEACAVIRNKFHLQINSIRKELFVGFNQAAFNNLLEANRIEEAYISANHQMNFGNKKSFDITPFIMKSNIMINQVEWKVDNSLPEKGNLAEIFVNSMAS